MEQTRALNALEPYIALSKSATSPRAAADLISQATSAPNTYIFAELVQTQNIQNLRQSEEYASHLALLELFAWGSWADYQTNAASLPKLNPQQEQKLRLLTLATLASTNTPTTSSLTYTNLIASLGLQSPRELENLVTAACYAGLMTATLDPLHGHAIINSTAPLRDVAPGSIADLQAQLDTWTARCDAVLAELAGSIATIKIDAAVRSESARRLEEAVAQETEAVERSQQYDETTRESRRQRARGPYGAFHRLMGGDRDSDVMDVR